MISIREQSYGLNVALYNEFTLEDFQEFEAAALKCVEKVHRPDMLLDLPRFPPDTGDPLFGLRHGVGLDPVQQVLCTAAEC